MDEIIVIGGGLAGSEAAWQIARRGGKVVLYEMRPTKGTPAHKTGNLAELVCSNSLKSKDLFNAHGLLKEELRRMGSLIIEAAEEAALPGGKALVVDR
ncbi:MAG: methylenetetrahydrofolate--tRNA-(uracil(54)-C(5))-methyltransferase (FADH(2)-oxidizing) TrmFO, partial [Candidatus Hydrothermota bacterium]